MKKYFLTMLAALALNGVAEEAKPIAQLQGEFLQWKFGLFLHFNVATFNNQEWANGYEDPTTFAPDKLDCGQWADAARAAGMKYAVLTVKHTGGWCLWDSQHTTHDATAFAHYKQGKGDIVREFVEAFRARGLKVGLYYCAPGNYDGKYGNPLPPGKPSLHGLPPEAAGDYTGFMKKQFTELLTQYGPIDLLWVDQFGNPYTGKDWLQIKEHIKLLQPNCVVLANNSHNFKQTDIHGYELPVYAGKRLEELLPVGNTNASEVCEKLGPGWFWNQNRDESKLQSAEKVAAMLKLCNERRANLLLDVAPDATGQLPALSVKRLQEIGKLLASSPAAEPAPSRFEHFITRQGDKLMDGDKEFRFIGANMPGLSLPYDFSMKLPERLVLPTPWEQADGLKTLDQMNLRVVRIWNLPSREPKDKPADGRMTWHYVQGPGQFNEESFKVLDHLFALANRYGIRVVFSLSDSASYVGGLSSYAGYRGKPAKAFFTDAQIKEDFKQTIRHVLTRRNTVSGVPYKEDKAIMCWELGNELWNEPYEVFAPWQSEMAAYVKSLDPNHLILDARANVIPKEPDPNVDIFNVHYYGNDFAASCRSNQAQSKGKRPFMIGEFGPYHGKGFTPDNVVDKTRDFLSAVQESGTAGALLWSMYFHHRDGGFYWHQIFTYPSVWSYHWPGFPSAEAQREIGIMRVMREAAFKIQGLPVPPVPVPDAPELLPIGEVPLLSWRGSAGASGYDIERAPRQDGPWTALATNVSDADIAYRPLFSDTTARAGQTYFYRITARNISGTSKPSNVVGPIAVKRVCLVDELQDFSRVHAKSDGLTLNNEYNALYAEYLFRAQGSTNDWITYQVEAPIESIKVVAFFAKDTADFTVQGSADGKMFDSLRPTRTERRLGTTMSGPARGQHRTMVEYECPIPAGNRYLKLLWNGAAELDRVEIYHRPRE